MLACLLDCVRNLLTRREALQTAAWHPAEAWASLLTRQCLGQLERLVQMGAFEQPSSRRLAFRELGTTIGVQVNPAARGAWADRVRALHAYWAPPRLFSRDRDITPVMYAVSLLPGAVSRAYEGRSPTRRTEEAQ